MKHLSCAFVLAAGVSCGGASTSPLLDGGDVDGATDAGPGGDAQPGKDAGNCQALLADLEQKRQDAVQCCLTCNTLQCTQQIEGMCCPLTVTSGDSLASKAYKDALQAVKDANCEINCPANACSTKPSNVCAQSGTCVQ